MKYELQYWDSPILQQACKPVTEFGKELDDLVAHMLVIMEKNNGIGLAANQIGSDKSVFVMKINPHHPMIFVNPRIIGSITTTTKIREGCLSFPDVQVEVPRAKSVYLRYNAIYGQEYKQGFDGLEAICVQHEIDHLNGITFLNYVSDFTRKNIERKVKKWISKKNLK